MSESYEKYLREKAKKDPELAAHLKKYPNPAGPKNGRTSSSSKLAAKNREEIKERVKKEKAPKTKLTLSGKRKRT